MEIQKWVLAEDKEILLIPIHDQGIKNSIFQMYCISIKFQAREVGAFFSRILGHNLRRIVWGNQVFFSPKKENFSNRLTTRRLPWPQKWNNLTSTSQFRPIILFNNSYKIISETMSIECTIFGKKIDLVQVHFYQNALFMMTSLSHMKSSISFGIWKVRNLS